MSKDKMLKEIDLIFKEKTSFSEKYNKDKNFRNEVFSIYEKMSLKNLKKAYKEIKRVINEK